MLGPGLRRALKTKSLEEAAAAAPEVFGVTGLQAAHGEKMVHDGRPQRAFLQIEDRIRMPQGEAVLERAVGIDGALAPRRETAKKAVSLQSGVRGDEPEKLL